MCNYWELKKSTRHTIIDVALSVFALRGLSNTTMDDVAKASGFGRRTLYTYFKTREELFHEVITKERDIIISQLSTVVEMKLPTAKKMAKIMAIHMKTIENIVNRNEALRLEFIKRSDRIEGYRTAIDRHEKQCLIEILQEGIAGGLYCVENIEATAAIILTSLKGMEREFILENFDKSTHETLKLFNNIILKGITSPAKKETRFQL